MTITFEYDNDVIVYALEKIIAYARRTQHIFVAQCVWWLASIIGLEQGLINYLDNLHSREEVSSAAEALSKEIPCAEVDEDTKEIRDLPEESITPCHIPGDPRSGATLDTVHPDRRDQIQVSDSDINSPDIDGFSPEDIVEKTKQFNSLSRKERKAVIKRTHNKLTRPRSRKVTTPITKKQRNYLQSISKDTITEYLKNRK